MTGCGQGCKTVRSGASCLLQRFQCDWAHRHPQLCTGKVRDKYVSKTQLGLACSSAEGSQLLSNTTATNSLLDTTLATGGHRISVI